MQFVRITGKFLFSYFWYYYASKPIQGFVSFKFYMEFKLNIFLNICYTANLEMLIKHPI